MEGSTAGGKKVMVVADPTRESTAALEYALSHAVLERDKLILLHVENPASWRYAFSMFIRRPVAGGSVVAAMASDMVGGEVDFLKEMKRVCEAAQPNIRVAIEKIEMDGKDKAETIMCKSVEDKIDLLVIGQRWSISTAILGYSKLGRSARGTKVVDTAEYLIENSKCTCVGVNRKGQNNGFLLNTKTHKNFWLLA